MARRVLDGGHELGNHTEHHGAIEAMSADAAYAEIQACADRLRKLTGSPGPLVPAQPDPARRRRGPGRLPPRRVPARSCPTTSTPATTWTRRRPRPRAASPRRARRLGRVAAPRPRRNGRRAARDARHPPAAGPGGGDGLGAVRVRRGPTPGPRENPCRTAGQPMRRPGERPRDPRPGDRRRPRARRVAGAVGTTALLLAAARLGGRAERPGWLGADGQGRHDPPGSLAGRNGGVKPGPGTATTRPGRRGPACRRPCRGCRLRRDRTCTPSTARDGVAGRSATRCPASTSRTPCRTR